MNTLDFDCNATVNITFSVLFEEDVVRAINANLMPEDYIVYNDDEVPENLTPAQIKGIKEYIEDYVSNNPDELENICDASITFISDPLYCDND